MQNINILLSGKVEKVAQIAFLRDDGVIWAMSKKHLHLLALPPQADLIFIGTLGPGVL